MMAASMMAGCKHDGGLQGESGDLSALFVPKAHIYTSKHARAVRAKIHRTHIFSRMRLQEARQRVRAHAASRDCVRAC